MRFSHRIFSLSPNVVAGLLVAVLVSLQLTLLVTSARSESQTVDEGAHMAAGYSYWRTGNFQLNPEHPPLIKLIASVPLLLLPIHFPADLASWQEGNEWEFAHQLIYHNNLAADTIIFWARFPMMLIGLLLSFTIYRESKRLWGMWGGLLSLIMVVLDPNFLAHSRYVTTDIGVTLLFFLTVMTYGRYLQRPHGHAWLPVMLWFALAQLAKFSAVLLWPVMILLWMARWWTAPDEHRHDYRFGIFIRRFGLLLLVSVAITWSLYGFAVMRPMQDPQVAARYATEEAWRSMTVDAEHKQALSLQRFSDPRTPTGALIKKLLTVTPVPAYMYIRGLLNVTFHNYWGHSSYLMGQVRVLGWWYYFPVAFAVKTPLPTVLLFLIAVVMLPLHLRRMYHVPRHRETLHGVLQHVRTFLNGRRFVYMTLLLPPILYFASSLTSHINLGVRHIFPVYPFLFVLSGALAKPLWNKFHSYHFTLVALLLAWLALSSFRTYPHYLSYFSDIVGGAQNGPQYLLDSNLDWGQGLKELGKYLDQYQIPFVYIAYFGQAPMEAYLKDFRYLPPTDRPDQIAALDGYAAISVTALYGEENTYQWLQQYTPVARIGNAIFVYDLRSTR